jgi:hypothetical protein
MNFRFCSVVVGGVGSGLPISLYFGNFTRLRLPFFFTENMKGLRVEVAIISIWLRALKNNFAFSHFFALAPQVDAPAGN